MSRIFECEACVTYGRRDAPCVVITGSGSFYPACCFPAHEVGPDFRLLVPEDEMEEEHDDDHEPCDGRYERD